MSFNCLPRTPWKSYRCPNGQPVYGNIWTIWDHEKSTPTHFTNMTVMYSFHRSTWWHLTMPRTTTHSWTHSRPFFNWKACPFTTYTITSGKWIGTMTRSLCISNIYSTAVSHISTTLLWKPASNTWPISLISTRKCANLTPMIQSLLIVYRLQQVTLYTARHLKPTL